MRWGLLLAVLLACGIRASYAPAPIRGGGPDSGLLLAPRSLPSGGIVPKGTMSQLSKHVTTFSNEMPRFIINPDQTITWAGMCVEANGQSSGDAVRINRCHGGPTQLWDVLPWGRYSLLQLKDSSLCIDAIHQEGGWHGAPVLRSCDNEKSEFGNLEGPIPRPTGSPSQDFFFEFGFSARLEIFSFFMFGMLLPLSLGTALRQWRKNTLVVAYSQGGVPLCMDQGGLALTLPIAFRHSSHQDIVPAVMVTDPVSDDEPMKGNGKKQSNLLYVDRHGARVCHPDESIAFESFIKERVEELEQATEEEIQEVTIRLDGDESDSGSSDWEVDVDNLSNVDVNYLGDVNLNQSGTDIPAFRLSLTVLERWKQTHHTVLERWKQTNREERGRENENGGRRGIRKVLTRGFKRALRKSRKVMSSLMDKRKSRRKSGRKSRRKSGSEEDMYEGIQRIIDLLKNENSKQPLFLQMPHSDDEDEGFKDWVTGKESVDTQKKAGLESLRNFNLKPQEVVEYLNRYIIQQDNAKKVLAVALCDHFNHVRRQLSAPDVEQKDYAKPNILLLGPTGVGKTYLMKTIARLIGVPFVKGDATKFSETGIVGQDAEELVRDLVDAANGNTELAQYGIIYVDEVDKITGGGEGGLAIGGGSPLARGVQNNFLKLLEDTDVQLAPEGGKLGAALNGMMGAKADSKAKIIKTRNILFIFSGAFVGLDAEIKRRKETRSLGFFDAAPEATDAPIEVKSYLRYAESKDLVSAGLEPEFVGRVPVRVALEALTAENLKEILTKAEGSVLKQFIADFEGYGIDMNVTDGALTHVATLADKEGTGARGLVTVLERTLREYKFSLPSSSITAFEVDDATVRSPTDGLAALLTSMTEEDKKFARMQDLKRWEKRLKQDVAPLEPSITDEAMDFLVQLSIQREEGAYWFATRRFEDLPLLLHQIAEATGERKVSIDLAWAQEPEEQFSKWRQKVERAKEEKGIILRPATF